MIHIEQLKTYKGSLTNLESASTQLLGSIKRDKDEFIQMGITQSHIDQYEADLTTFKAYRHDRKDLLQMRQAKQQTDNLFAQLRHNYNEFLVKLQVQPVQAADQVWYFMQDSSHTGRQNQLIRSYSQSFLQMHTYANQLKSVGVTPQWLQHQELLLQQLRQTMAHRHFLANQRNLTAEKRWQLATKIYSAISIFCKVGKFIARRNANNAQYNDYMASRLFGSKSATTLSKSINNQPENQPNPPTPDSAEADT